MENLTQIKANYDFSQILELNVKNKIIRNLSHLSFILSRTLSKIDLSQNEIESIGNEFSVESNYSYLSKLSFSENKLAHFNVYN